jgi:di/tricarboxylate transporter
LNSKTIGLAIGAILIIIALILGGIQISHAYDIVSHPTPTYFYALVGIIGLIGIIVAAWALMKKEAPKATKTTATTATTTQ